MKVTARHGGSRVVHQRLAIACERWGTGWGTCRSLFLNSCENKLIGKQLGGERGIRTPDTVSRLHAFQACALNHSATSPGVAASNRRNIAAGWPSARRAECQGELEIAVLGEAALGNGRDRFRSKLARANGAPATAEVGSLATTAAVTVTTAHGRAAVRNFDQ